MNIRQSSTHHYYSLALLCWCPLTLGFLRSAPQPSQANTWVCQPGQKALQGVGEFWNIFEDLWASQAAHHISVARFGVHGICDISDIAWCLCTRICIKHRDLDVRHWVGISCLFWGILFARLDGDEGTAQIARLGRKEVLEALQDIPSSASSRNTDMNGLHWLLWCWIIWSSHSFACLRWSKVELPRNHLPNPSATSEAQAASEVVSCLGEYLALVVRILIPCNLPSKRLPKDLTQAIDSLRLIFEMQRMVSHDPCNYTTCNTCTLPPSWEKRSVWQSRTVSRKIYRS